MGLRIGFTYMGRLPLRAQAGVPFISAGSTEGLRFGAKRKRSSDGALLDTLGNIHLTELSSAIVCARTPLVMMTASAVIGRDILSRTQMASRIASYDWSGTPLGAAENWPETLNRGTDVARFAIPHVSLVGQRSDQHL